MKSQTLTNLQNLPNNNCSRNTNPTFSCITRQCPHPAFLCQNQTCPQCHSLHQHCIILKTSRILKNLHSKTISTQSLQDAINSKADQLIDIISLNRDQNLLYLQNYFEYFGLNQWQTQLVKSLNQNKPPNVTGHQLWQIHRCLKLPESILQPSIDNINDFFSNLTQEILQKLTIIQSDLKNLLLSTKASIQSQQLIINEAYKKCNSEQSVSIQVANQKNKLFVGSQIVEKKELETILKFFDPKKLKSSTLLYRASENGFLVSKFHQNCDAFANTLVLCETEFKKKIGGYASLPWQPVEGSYKKDQFSKSFIFSLSQNDKLILQNRQKALYCSQSCGPAFGSSDLYIRDSAHTKQQSYAKINNDYYKSKYSKDDKESWRSFSGSQTSKFKIKEWQVWNLEFEL